MGCPRPCVCGGSDEGTTGRGDGTQKLRKNGLALALCGAKWLRSSWKSDVGVVDFCPIPEKSWEIPETAYLTCSNKGTAFNQCLQALQNKNHTYLQYTSRPKVLSNEPRPEMYVRSSRHVGNQLTTD